MNLSSELNQSCEELRQFGNQELSDNADLGLRYSYNTGTRDVWNILH